MSWAIVLAGSANNGQLQECSKAKEEALIKIGQKYMVQYIVEALKNSQIIQKIAIVGCETELEKIYDKDAQIYLVPKGNTIVNSLLNGLKYIDNDDKKVLIVSSDIPLIKGEMIDDFIKRCSPFEADVFYPIIKKSSIDNNYPEAMRTYVNLKEGIYTGGNLVYINPLIIKPCAEKAEKLIALRKSPLKLAGFIGARFIIKLLSHTLSIKEAEKKAGEILNIKGKAIEVPWAEIGMDIDKPSDYYLARKLLNAN